MKIDIYGYHFGYMISLSNIYGFYFLQSLSQTTILRVFRTKVCFIFLDFRLYYKTFSFSYLLFLLFSSFVSRSMWFLYIYRNPMAINFFLLVYFITCFDLFHFLIFPIIIYILLTHFVGAKQTSVPFFEVPFWNSSPGWHPTTSR